MRPMLAAILASGLSAPVNGMVPTANTDSYDWTSDKSEMTSRAGAYPGELGKIYVPNHSYGFISGWNYTAKASRMWGLWGNGTTAAEVEQNFANYYTRTF